jgi:hypothetical protein
VGLEDVERDEGYTDPSTTKLYDRRQSQLEERLTVQGED